MVFKGLLKLIVGLCLFPVFIWAQEPLFQSESLRILSPPQGFVTTTDNVTISGIVAPDISAIEINGMKIPLINRHFFVQKRLSKGGKNPLNFSTYTKTRLLGRQVLVDESILTVTYSKSNLLESGLEITLFSPKENEITSKPRILFKGQTKSAKYLKLNGATIPLREDGSFFFRDTLTKLNSYHLFTLTAVSEDGGEITLERKIYYKGLSPDSPVVKEVVRPMIEIMAPPNNFLSHKEKVLFKGRTKHLTRLEINGIPVAMNSKGDFFNRQVLEERGKYKTFLIEGFNELGEKLTKKLRIFFAKDKPNPVISKKLGLVLTAPGNNFITYKNKILFKGKAENAKTVWINDVPIPFDNAGQFFVRQEVKTLNAYNEYVVKALGPNGEIKRIQPSNLGSQKLFSFFSAKNIRRWIRLISPFGPRALTTYSL